MTFEPPRRSTAFDGTVGEGPPFADAVLAQRPALLAFALRLARNEVDAEDLVQDTMLRALAAGGRFEDGANLEAWLFTILRNAFNTQWRRARRECLPGSEVIERSATMPSTQVDGLWAREAIDRLLHDLSPSHREILILVPVLGLGYEDAAEVCGCSVGTVKSRLSRARTALAALAGGPGP